MKLENQVCSLEQAKKLKELGVAQDGLCIYEKHFDEHILLFKTGLPYEIEAYCAFTVAELGVMLPETLHEEKLFMCCVHNNGTNACGYIENVDNDFGAWIYDEEGATEAEARASMLIWLIENKYVSVEDINARLVA